MKRGERLAFVLVFAAILMLSVSSLASASWLGDLWGKITGEEVQLSPGDSVSSSLSGTQAKTFVAGGISYEIQINYMSSNKVKLSVNGVVTNALSRGSIETLADGATLKITRILYSSRAGGARSVSFTLTAPIKPTCNDSDGGKNYDVRGEVTEGSKYSNWTSNIYSDMCVTDRPGINLAEAVCEKRQDGFYYGSQSEYYCQYGCSNGACIAAPSNTTNATTPSKFSTITINRSGDDSFALTYAEPGASTYNAYLLKIYAVTRDNPAPGINTTTILDFMTGNSVCDQKKVGEICYYGNAYFEISAIDVRASGVVTLKAGNSNVKFFRVARY